MSLFDNGFSAWTMLIMTCVCAAESVQKQPDSRPLQRRSFLLFAFNAIILMSTVLGPSNFRTEGGRLIQQRRQNILRSWLRRWFNVSWHRCPRPPGLLQFTYKKNSAGFLQATGKQSKQHGQLIPDFKTFSSKRPDRVQEKFNQLASFAPGPTGENDEGQIPSGGSKYGIYLSYKEHVDRALQLEHPSNISSTVPDVLRRNLLDLLTMGYTAMAKKRILLG